MAVLYTNAGIDVSLKGARLFLQGSRRGSITGECIKKKPRGDYK